MTATREQIASAAIVRAVRHIAVWSFLVATLVGWIAPLAPAGAWQIAARRSVAADFLPDACDAGDSAFLRPGPALAGANGPARAASFVTLHQGLTLATHAVRRSVATATTSDRRRIPLYGLFRVYRI